MRLSDAGSWQIPGPCLLPLQLSFSLITDKVQVLHTCPSLQKGGDSKKLLGVTDSDRAEESCRGRTGTRAHTSHKVLNNLFYHLCGHAERGCRAGVPAAGFPSPGRWGWPLVGIPGLCPLSLPWPPPKPRGPNPYLRGPIILSLS